MFKKILILYLILTIIFITILIKTTNIKDNFINTKKKNLVIIPINGLINRIQAIVSSKLLADKYNMDLIIYWTIDHDSCNCEYKDIFGKNKIWKENINNKYNIDISKLQLDVINEETDKIYYWELSNNQQKLQDFFKNDKKIKIIKSGGKFFIEKEQDKTTSLLFRSVQQQLSKIYKKIIFNKNILKKVKKIPFSTLGVHIRCTDIKKECIDTEIIVSKIKSIIEKHNIKNIFIISNNLDKVDTITKHLTINTNINIIKSDTKNTDRNSSENIKNALVDWLNLTKCNYLLLTKLSSYSEEASNYNMCKNIYWIDSHRHFNIKGY